MKLTFITTSLGIFGSIRELIENANRLVDYGHDVAIHSDLKKYPFNNWLPCKAKLYQLGKIDKCDALILMDTPFDYHMDNFVSCDAKYKTIIMMGFSHDFKFVLGNDLYNYNGVSSEKNLFEILKNYEICADANWQLTHLKKIGVKTGVAIGGVNLDMFKDLNLNRTIQLGFSGDKRARKASHIVNHALKELNYTFDHYFGKGNQDYLVNFLNKCEIFVDNHVRAGWVNPVLEAMASGAVPICRYLPALEEFATDDTAIVLHNPDKEDFKTAITELINDKHKIKQLKESARIHIQQFSYDVITKNFEQYLLSKI